MSSSDRGYRISRRAGIRGLAAALVAGMLGACTVQPLYGPAAGGGTVQSTLTRIAIAPVKDRVSQQVRNNVLFQLTGGKTVGDPLYRMKLTVTSREVGLGITNIDSSPVFSVRLAATYEVTNIASGEQLVRGTARTSASYNRSNQAFANTRAKIDAENRAAAEAAREISTRVAAAVAAGS
ncbi:LPS assembly lipoprotein LptE [Bauldia sp.]|uniref:LPS assembly lipoprotein LptE n=1 Tax=Bauldia sp. TaxID=2575872 RepID=UPI003BAC379C